MKIIFLMILTTTLFVACNREDRAGSVGSGAGIQEEQHSGRSDAAGKGEEDMNITTPIYDDEEEE